MIYKVYFSILKQRHHSSVFLISSGKVKTS